MIGAIDGTLITIHKFSSEMKDYIRRREKYELNVLIVCGPDHLIYYCSTHWPGAVNDGRIFRECDLKDTLESGEHIYCFLNSSSKMYKHELSNTKCQ